MVRLAEHGHARRDRQTVDGDRDLLALNSQLVARRRLVLPKLLQLLRHQAVHWEQRREHHSTQLTLQRARPTRTLQRIQALGTGQALRSLRTLRSQETLRPRR